MDIHISEHVKIHMPQAIFKQLQKIRGKKTRKTEEIIFVGPLHVSRSQDIYGT